MNTKDLLAKLSKTVSSFLSVQKFMDVKDKDGILYRLPEAGIAVDSTLEVINEDGTLTPALDGTYEIEGNTVVTVGGVITEVTPIEAPAEEAPEEAEVPMAEGEEIVPVTEEAPEVEDDKLKELAVIVDQVLQAVKSIDGRVAALENVTEFKTKFEKLAQRIDTLESKPVNKTVKTNNFSTEETNPYILRLRNLK